MKLLIALGLFLSFNSALAQFKTKTVRAAILNADTVMLVSHDLTELRILDEATGKVRSAPPVVIEEKPNWNIIHESVVLDNKARLRLIQILTQPSNEKVELMKCFMPHHSVLLVKNHKTSFIEVCFACQQLAASKGIGLNDIHYPSKMWQELELFFTGNNIHYQIPFDMELDHQ